MALIKTYNGASWDEPEPKVYDGSAWVGLMKFYDGTAWQELFSGDDVYTVTVATSGVNYGYGSTHGSVSPDPAVLNGQTIDVMRSVLSSYDFEIHILGTFLAQTFFTSLVVNDGDGNDQTYTSASATFSNTSTRARWRWGSGGSGTVIWDSFDAAENHDVTITL